MSDEKRRFDPITFLITRGGLPVLLLLSLLAIPVGLIAAYYVYWPLGIAYLLGVHITDGMFLVLIVLPFALALFLAFFFPSQGTTFFEFLGKLYGLALASFSFFLFIALIPATFIGYPLMLEVNYVFGITLPVWSFLPLSLAAVGLYIVLGNRLKPKT